MSGSCSLSGNARVIYDSDAIEIWGEVPEFVTLGRILGSRGRVKDPVLRVKMAPVMVTDGSGPIK